MIARHHHDDGRPHRLVVAAHPIPRRPHDAHSCENRIEVPGTPEQVWEAIATGPGIEAWFVPAEVEPRDGGRVALDMGTGMEDAGVVTAWEPPHRFVYEEEWQAVEGEPAGRLATEFLVEARSGGTCVVRLVSTLYAGGASWDDVLESMREGWSVYLSTCAWR